MYDPFRIQFLTISLDSEFVLAIVGVLLAGLVARDAGARLGRSPERLWDTTLDVAFWTIVGARLGWVVGHPEYYVRAPLQIFAVGDGGFVFASEALAAALVLRRAATRLDLSWSELGTLAAPAIAVALLLDRAGCALGACGAGQPTDVPWALVRSGASLQPTGLYGLAIWLIAWLTLTSVRAVVMRGQEWLILLAALVVDRWLAWWLGHEGIDGVVASAGLAVVAGATWWRDRERVAARSSREMPT